MEYFIDSNIFLRVAIEENKRTFQACKNILNSIKTGKIKAFTSSLVLVETQWVLSSFYKVSKGETLKIIQGIVALRHLRIEDDFDIKWALEIYSQEPIKFMDCLLASHSRIREGKVIIVSYDRDFDRIKNVNRKEPSIM